MPTRPFQLLIKPVGADCNLRCSYCFYLRAHELYPDPGRHIMNDAVLERIISELLRHRFPQTVFAWQGGEPSLAGLDFYERAIEFQKRHGVNGQSVGNAFQTNGMLIDAAWCRLFNQYSFLIGLSIDGPKELHDRHRMNAVGQGSWDRAMAAAECMRRHNVAFNILVLVNRDNLAMGADLLRWFAREGFDYVQFIPCMEKDSPYNVDPEAYGRFLCDVYDCWSRDYFGKVSIRDFDALVCSHMGVPGGLCTFGERCQDYIVVEHDGGVYPCDFFVYDEWRLGNILDAPIESFMDTAKYRQFATQKNKTPACRGCEWRPMCHGGCQKDRMSAGALSGPSPLCPAYKRFFAHVRPKLKALARRCREANAACDQNAR